MNLCRQSDISAFEYAVSVQFSRSVVSDSLQPHGLQHARLPCPSPTPRIYPKSCPLNRWCHLTISSSIVPFSFHLQSFPASGFFPMSQFFASGGQSIGVSVSASVLPMNILDWFPLGWTGWISLPSKELSRVFSNTTVQKHHTLSRFVIAFLPRSKSLLISWLQSLSTVILDTKKIETITASTFSSSICHAVMGLDVMVLVFWMLSLFFLIFYA